MNKAILLHKRPIGLPKLTDFKIISEQKPEIRTGEVLLKTLYVSVDPYLRGRMNDVESYIPPFELNKPLKSGIIAEIVESKHPNFELGGFVSGLLEWKEMQVSKGEGLMKIDSKIAPLTSYLGVLGITGLTAYLGLIEIGKPKKGETLLVSGAAGAVGSIVGQIGKLLGLHVVGIAGTAEKVEMLVSEYGFDGAINYKESFNMVEAIKSACPDGVDIYFDNVGGPISDAVLFNINTYARTIQCGAISVYNETSLPKSLPVHTFLIRKRALMQGFIIFDYEEKYPEALAKLTQWYKDGILKSTETIQEGFENIPNALIGLFKGANTGKMIVKI